MRNLPFDFPLEGMTRTFRVPIEHCWVERRFDGELLRRHGYSFELMKGKVLLKFVNGMVDDHVVANVLFRFLKDKRGEYETSDHVEIRHSVWRIEKVPMDWVEALKDRWWAQVVEFQRQWRQEYGEGFFSRGVYEWLQPVYRDVIVETETVIHNHVHIKRMEETRICPHMTDETVENDASHFEFMVFDGWRTR